MKRVTRVCIQLFINETDKEGNKGIVRTVTHYEQVAVWGNEVDAVEKAIKQGTQTAYAQRGY